MTDVLLRAATTSRREPVDAPPTPAAVRRPRAETVRVLLIGTIVALAVLCRLFWVFNVHNPDGAALAWGSSLVAQGESDPYSATVRNAGDDPVQPDQVRPLPLALGYGAVYAGAAVLATADAVGVIDLDSQTERSALQGPNPTVALYKLTYLLPELIALGCVWYLFSGAARRAALAVLVLNPLTFFAYGQGLPDLWQAAVILGALALVTAFERTGRRRYAYAAVAVIILGAFSVKLMPLIVAAGLVVYLLRSQGFATRRDRAVLLATTAGCASLGVLPYLLNHYAWLSLTARFEVGMVLGSNAFTAVGNLAGSPLWLTVAIAGFAWLFLRPEMPDDALATWIVIASASLAFAAGGVQQFMLWGVAALIILSARYALVTALLVVGATAATALSFLTFPWYDTLLTSGLGVDAAVGSGPELLIGLPSSEAYGPFAAGLLLVGTALAVIVLLAGHGSPFAQRLGNQPRRWLVVVTAGCTLLLPVALLLATGIKANHGATSVNLLDILPRESASTPTDVDLARPRRIEVPASAVSTVGAQWPVRSVALLASPRTLPSSAEVIVTLNAADGSTTSGSIPAGELEPLSGLGPVGVPLDEPILFTGGEVVFSCRQLEPYETTDCGDVWLEGATNAEGQTVPSLTVRVGDEASAVLGSATTALVRPANAWIVLLSAATGAAIALAARRLAAGQEDTRTLTRAHRS